MIYLGSPYTHPDPAVREQRFLAVCRAAGLMMEAGEIIYSPIAHSHPISLTMRVSPTDHDFWMRQCLGVLARCNVFRVLTLDGWEQSRGLAAELEFARLNQIPIQFRAP